MLRNRWTPSSGMGVDVMCRNHVRVSLRRLALRVSRDRQAVDGRHHRRDYRSTIPRSERRLAMPPRSEPSRQRRWRGLSLWLRQIVARRPAAHCPAGQIKVRCYSSDHWQLFVVRARPPRTLVIVQILPLLARHVSPTRQKPKPHGRSANAGAANQMSARKARMILITELLPHILRWGVVSNEVGAYS